MMQHSTQSGDYVLTLNAFKLTLILSVFVVFLLSVDALVQIAHYRWHEVPWLIRRFFDVDEEINLPTWYSSAALLLASALLFLVHKRKAAMGAPWSVHWLLLSIGFLGLSMDEVAAVHDSVNAATRSSWAIPAGAIAVAIGLMFSRFLISLPLKTSVLFVIGGIIFLGGAVGVEVHTEWYNEINYADSLPYKLWTIVEEGLEMFGVIIFIYALVSYMEMDTGNPSVVLRSPE